MKRILVIAVAITAGVAVSAAVPNGDQAIVHVLNRVAFGPRPGDVDRVRSLGLERYIDEQLRPERLPDPSMNDRLRGLTTIGLSAGEIAERYERPAMEARRERRQKAKDAEPAPEAQKARDPMRQQANSVVAELAEQKVLRAVYSERQLQEVLTDFWFNHFNVDARKNRERFLLTVYERDAIRPHVLGTFRDLLEATARDPAMLVYLDNWMSAAERSATLARSRESASGRGQRRTRAAQAGAARAQRKLRARADGAAHARRRRRLHAEGRHRGGARLHRLDD